MANLSSFYTTSPLVTANVVSTLTANNANFLGGNAANTYAPLANPTFTGTVSTANVTINGAITANSSAGSAGQVLASNGTSVYWTTVAANPFSSNTSLAQVQATALCF